MTKIQRVQLPIAKASGAQRVIITKYMRQGCLVDLLPIARVQQA